MLDDHDAPPPASCGKSLTKPDAAKTSETAGFLSRLLLSFPERDSDDGAKIERSRSYLVAVEGYSLAVLEEAERLILKAKVPDIDPRFMPIPPQLARLCDEIQARRHREAQPIEPEPEPMSEPQVAVVLKFERAMKEFAKAADSHQHETRREWIKRMGDRIKLLPEPKHDSA